MGVSGTRFVARLTAVAAAAALLLAARAVAADAVDPRVSEAARRCADGDARVGVALLMRVHVDTLEPRYVLDQASCLERNGQPAAAAERLQFFLRLQGTVAESDRRDAEAWLGRLQSATQPEGLSQSLSDRHRDPRPRAMSRRRLGSLLLAGAAGGVLVGATSLHLTRETRAAAYNRRCYPLHGTSCDQLRGRVQAAQVGAVIGYLTAALLAGGAVYLHATAPERDTGERQAFHCRRGERSGELVCGTIY
jgi:hypothetical protein